MPPRRPSTARALTRALKSRPVQPWEEASIALARRLAIELDAAADLEDVARMSRQLLAVLRSLGMTRDKIVIPQPPGSADEPRPLDTLRQRHARLTDPSAGDGTGA